MEILRFEEFLNERKFTPEERKKDAKSGKAMPDGSFPIENAKDLKNAIKAHGRARDPKAAKRHIKKRAKELGLENLTPETEFLNESLASKELPSIFMRTIYRMPLDEELVEVHSFDLNSEQILAGFSYTIIGRGIKDSQNIKMIVDSINKLCEMYPDNHNYISALEEARKIKPRFTT